ncbi:fimbrial biogenesis chaperone [Stenotrophomonas maltophilia]|uniref:fimbrial biogenesis chaperone n=1 Tax=Stenotrophomonas maltophilia TaxID=40324 RepID=UPI001E543EA5|nr:fimbria/pilus periplasmic chaperone [Stenotrophomonas maltophilia]MCD5965574.1 fimbria/pilus periplasmic chaperone [Stenotrophomonas maltophilia]
MIKKLLTLALFSVPLLASAVSMGPLATVYTGNEKTGVLTINNSDGPSTVTYSISVESVSVENGRAKRSPSQNIRFAPSVVTVGPGKTQTVRFLRTPMGGGEEVYRIRATQLSNPEIKGIQTLSSLDFPWIFRSADAKPQLTARWVGGKWLVTNTGNATAQLASAVGVGKTKTGLLGYVYPGETREFALTGFSPGSVSVLVNGQPMELKNE